MKLDLRDIIHAPGKRAEFDYELDLSDLEFYGEKPIRNPVRFCGVVENRADALFLSGTVSSRLSLRCDRCLKPISREKVIPVESLLAETLENGDGDDDILLLEDGALDLDAVATEAFVLAMDTKNLCSENCKGLCPRCGADLNLGPCGCKPEVDPRLAALARLLDDKTE